MFRRALLVLALGVVLASGSAEGAVKATPMIDRLGVTLGTAKVTLAKGSVALTAKLARLPATIDTGAAPFEATIYKAYLASSTDPAAEVPLGSVYPNAKGVASVRAALKGDLSGLGLDRVVIVAFSKDGANSFDVLTGTLAVQ